MASAVNMVVTANLEDADREAVSAIDLAQATQASNDEELKVTHREEEKKEVA